MVQHRSPHDPDRLYQVRRAGGSLSIVQDGVPLLTDITPSLSLNHTLLILLESGREWTEPGRDAAGAYTEYGFDYANEEVNVAVRLRFRCYDRCLLAYADVDIPPKNSIFDAHDYSLSPEHGIRLAMAPAGEITHNAMANYTYSAWWCKPHFTGDVGRLPGRVNSLLWSDGVQYHHLLPVCHDLFRTELRGSENGLEALSSCHAGNVRKATVLLLALGSDADPYRLARTTVSAALKAHHTTGRMREDRKYPDIFEYLGWCSWDALYYDLSESAVFDKMAELNKLRLPVRWAILDDGWSTNEYVPPNPPPPKDPNALPYPKGHRLTSFGARPSAFPGGLSHTIRQLKETYGLRWVGVWHAFTAYWSGIEPGSGLAAEYGEYLLTTNAGNVLPHPDSARGFGFWHAWYAFLKKEGVDFVKVDNQSSLGKLVAAEMSVARAAKGTHEAIEGAAGLHFDGAVINCMGMSPEHVWQRPASAVARSSMDFLPNHDKTFRDHVLANMYNSYYTGNFIWGDWDMWWTVHPESVQHSVLRAVSGGPVYISDPAGRTDPDRLWPLILRDGNVLRCDRPGLPAEDCLLRNPQVERLPAKIWNRSGDCGVLALFNIHKEGVQVEGSASPVDIPDLDRDCSRFAVYDYFQRRAAVLRYEDKVETTLDDLAAALYVVVPMADGFAPIGLIDKYVSPATVSAVKRSGDTAWVVVKEGGTFGFVSDRRPEHIAVDGKPIAATEMDGFYAVRCDSGSEACMICLTWTGGRQ